MLLPASEHEVREALDKLKLAKLIRGFRGKPQGDEDAFVRLVLDLAEFAENHADKIGEIDLNPVMIRPEGWGVMVVDVLLAMAE